MVQWLIIHPLLQGCRSDPWSGKIPHAVWQPHTTTTKAMCPRGCALQQEKPPHQKPLHHYSRVPHSPQLEEARTHQPKPSTAENNFFFLKNWNSGQIRNTNACGYQADHTWEFVEYTVRECFSVSLKSVLPGTIPQG